MCYTVVMEHFNIYLAGVIDSDGSISIIKRLRQSTTRGYHYRELVQISWKREAGTERLANEIKDRYGGGVYITANGGFNGDTPIIKYGCEGKIAERLLKDIIPFMQLKKPQAELALRMRSLKSSGYGVGRPKPDSVWEEEDSIYAKMLKQKARGRV